MTFVFTKFQADRVNVIVPKVLPCTKSNPQIQVRIPMHKTVEKSNNILFSSVNKFIRLDVRTLTR